MKQQFEEITRLNIYFKATVTNSTCFRLKDRYRDQQREPELRNRFHMHEADLWERKHNNAVGSEGLFNEVLLS
jgi:hypothetical protein